MENGIASRGLAPVRESRKTAQGTMFVTRTWYLFRIIPWGTRQQPEVSNQDVIDRYALQPAILQKVWMDRVKQYSDNDGKLQQARCSESRHAGDDAPSFPRRAL